jgi:regulator of ribonuclease activity A
MSSLDHKQSLTARSISTAVGSVGSGQDVATADLSDDFVASPTRLNVVQPNLFRDYGGRKSFYGPIETIRCLESNPMVRQTVSEPGHGRVLVVDGGGSMRVALLGDMLAQFAVDNGWSGLIINGCIRDSKIIGQNHRLGVKALGTYPVKSLKDQAGERGVNVYVGGVEFIPGHWVYADEVSCKNGQRSNGKSPN